MLERGECCVGIRQSHWTDDHQDGQERGKIRFDHKWKAVWAIHLRCGGRPRGLNTHNRLHGLGPAGRQGKECPRHYPQIGPCARLRRDSAVRKPHLIGGASLGGAFSMTGGLVSYFWGTFQNGIDKKAILEYNMLVSCGTIAKG